MLAEGVESFWTPTVLNTAMSWLVSQETSPLTAKCLP
jgi:hypothetical protein